MCGVELFVIGNQEAPQMSSNVGIGKKTLRWEEKHVGLGFRVT